jgi:hypothetical protein
MLLRDAPKYKLFHIPVFVLALLPWLVLPLDLILFADYNRNGSFLYYSFSRHFRSKELRVYGLVYDALYAHVIPATLALAFCSLLDYH